MKNAALARIILALVAIAMLACSGAAPAAAIARPALSNVPVMVDAPKAETAEAPEEAQAESEEELEMRRKLVARRMKADEVTTAHGLEATRILKSTYHLPMGSEIPYELEGEPFMAKIELHWHEPHVHPLPWGWHRGISLYVLEPAS